MSHAIVIALLDEIKALPTQDEEQLVTFRVVAYFQGLAELAAAGVLEPKMFMQFANDVSRLLVLIREKASK